MSSDFQRSVLRTSARAVVFGFWTVLIGLLVIYLAIRTGAFLVPAASSSGVAGNLGLATAFQQSLLAMYGGGAAAVAIGFLIIGIGFRFLRTAR